MSMSDIYRDIAERTGGKIFVGVVGPVRTGKSTFIKRFIEKLVIPTLSDPFLLERTRDELPQSGSGKTIMTAEPKFIPEEAINIELEKGVECSLRIVDCVGYMVNGAAGNIEDGGERMVMTPWYDYEIPISKAAEEGTRRVISDHSNIGIVITTDGSVCGIDRDNYLKAEERAIEELKTSGKPFVVLLNCSEPNSPESILIAENIGNKHNCECIAVNCLRLEKEDISSIMYRCLKIFPIEKYCISIPEWLEALPNDNEIKKILYKGILDSCEGYCTIEDAENIKTKLSAIDNVSEVEITSIKMGNGCLGVKINMPSRLYYETLSKESGFDIRSDHDLIRILTTLSALKGEYDRFHEALEEVDCYGYGVVMPSQDDMKLEEPQVVKQGARYGVKLKASAPSIHMIRTNIETEVSPAIGGERTSEDMINFLIQGFDGDMSRIWESNIFGKSLNDIASEALAGKIKALKEETKDKLRGTIQRIVNEGSGGLICIIL